jgi:hypothetical protein
VGRKDRLVLARMRARREPDRPARERPRELGHRMGSAGGGGASYFRLPETATWEAPSEAKRSASAGVCARHSENRSRSAPLADGKPRQRRNERSDMRPLTSMSGTCRASISTIAFGQSSDSAKSARSGRQWSRKRRM